MKNKKILLIITMFVVVITMIGGTYAYWNWNTAENQWTYIDVTIPDVCTVSVDGGVTVDSTSIDMMPASCTNTANAIKKEIKITVEFKESDEPAYVDLWLDIDSIASELSATENFRYAVTDSSTSCADGAVFSGSFKGLQSGNKVRIFNKTYTGTAPETISETYYLYIWLDAAETSVETAGKGFQLSLNGDCSNYVDETPPGATITSTNNVASTQTATLTMSDDEEIMSYYFGKTNPNTSEVTWNVVNTTSSLTKTAIVDSGGTWYLAVKDDAENMTVVNKVFYKTTLNVAEGAGTVSPASVITMKGNSFTIPTPTLTNSNYTFMGWYENSSFTGSALTTYIPSSSKTLYANISLGLLEGGAVTISGTNAVGSTLTANVTDTTPVATYSYQWYTNTTNSTSGGTAISGATSSTFTLTSSQAGKYVYVVVTASKENYEDLTFADITDTTNNQTTITYNIATIPTASYCKSDLVYTGSSQTLTNTAGTGYTFSNNTGTNRGSYTVSANLNTNYMWSDYTTEAKTFTCSIGYGTGTISLSAKTTTYTGSAISANTATTNSGGTVSYVYYTNSTCSTQTTTSTGASATGGAPVDAGTYYVKATVAATSNYTSATTSCTAHTISAKSVTISWSDTSVTYNGSEQKPTATATSGITGETISCSTTGGTNANTYTSTATCTVSGGRAKIANYSLSPTTQSFTIGKATGTISLTAKTATYTGSAISANTATTNSGGTVSYVYYSDSTCSTKTATTTGASAAGGAPIDAGTYYVKATVAATTNYTSATTSCTAHTINAKSATITWGSTTSFTYSGSAQGPTVSAATGITGETMTASRTTGTKVGSYTSTASCSNVSGGRAKCSNYTVSSTKAFTITQKKATITVSKTTLSLTYAGSVTGTFTYTYDGDGTLSCKSSNTNITCSISNGTATITANAAGTATITLSATAGTNYSAPDNKTVSVTSTAKTYTITFNDNGGSGGPGTQTKTYGTALTISSTKPTRSGYAFVGWGDASNSTTAAIQPGGSYTANAAKTYYAVWTQTFAGYISSIYNGSTTYTNNSVTYYYDTTDLLMNDGSGSGGTSSQTSGNIRYYGESPSNYVYFNCTTYPSTTCELWRIIGVFTVDGVRKVKIMRDDPIQGISWDNKGNGVGTSTNTAGSNDWADARLMILLNPTTYTSSISTSIYEYTKGIYWNAASATCYIGTSAGANQTCTFTSNGLKNAATRNMIAETTWPNYGTTKESNPYYLYANQLYSQERSGSSTSSTTSWKGKVAVPYASDYMYAYNLNSCTYYLRTAGNQTCRDNNWMNNDGYVFWTMTHRAASDYYVVAIVGNNYGYGTEYGANNINYVYPTVFLDASVIKVGGSGTSSSPYQINLP